MIFGKYNILKTQEDIEGLDEYLENGKFELISVDTETNGLFFWKDLVIGLSLSVNADSGFYIPFLTWIPDLDSKKRRKIKKIEMEVYENGAFECIWTGQKYPENVTNKQYKYPEFIVKYLKKWLKDANPQLLMHNAPFDVLMIQHSLGFDLSEQLFCDTQLLKHVIDENTSNSLKETAISWSTELGMDYERAANEEQIEMGKSVLRNGGTFNTTQKHIWRADLEVEGKYAIADTFLTFGVFEVGMQKLMTEYEPRHLEWFFNDEVMPLCREVMIPMKRHGVKIDVDYFNQLQVETHEKMEELEDLILKELEPSLGEFSIGKSVDQVATKKALIETIIQKEGLEYPTILVKGAIKKSLNKVAIKAAQEKDPHWLWDYILGVGELRYSTDELNSLKKDIYRTRTGKKERFNIGSDAHLRWLFCKKFEVDPNSLPQTDSGTKDKPVPSMAAEVLEQFFLNKYSFVKPLMLWKRLKKLHSTYILPALNLNNNGYLHMDFLQTGTTSGRFSCTGGFNLQTLPKAEEIDRCPKCGAKDIVVVNPVKLVAVLGCNECGHLEEGIICPSAIKKGFIAPADTKIVNADYSSLEPRCFAFMSGDPKIKDVYFKNLDFYSKVYCDMEDPTGKYSPDPKAPNFLKKLDNAKRSMVKPVVLGIPYGARGPQTANLMGFKKIIIDKWSGKEKEILDVERGIAFRDKYLNTYPHLKKYMESQELTACTKGFVETIVGRRRHFKFTMPVFELLQKADLTIEEFLDIPRKELAKTAYNKVLSYNAFKQLSETCGFNMFDEKKKYPRGWDFVRAMFKNELNNSKNYPIQGIAAHIANRAMLEMTRAFKAKGLDSIVVLQVHDEITTYSKLKDVEMTVQIQKETMEKNQFAMKVDIPMIADPIVAENLKEAK